MSSIPLPALSVKAPQMESPVEQYGNLLRLKAMSQQGALQQQELISATRQNEQTQAINSAYHDAITMDESGQPKIDSAKLTKALAANGHGSAVPGILKSIQDYQKSAVDVQEAQDKIRTQAQESLGFLGSAIQKANYDPHLADLMIEQHLRSPNASPQEVQQLQQMRSQIQQNPEMLKTLADSFVAQAPKQQEMKNARDVANIRSSSVDKIEMQDWLAKNPGKTPADYQQFKVDQGVAATVAKETNPDVLNARKNLAVETARAEGPTKVAIAGEEEKQRQQIQGQVKPGYAFEPETGRTILTNQTDYLNSGGKLQAFRPVTETEVSDDRLLNNRLADVTQKIARYEATLQKSLPADDVLKMSGVIDPENKLKAGISHTELPVDSFNQLFKSSLMNHLSPEAQQRLIAYRNASEAMIGYQRILSGSGRSSDKAMELNIASLPHPLNSPDYANEAISQFKENLKIAAQGLPSLPGLKSPGEVVQSMSNKSQTGKTLTRAAIRQAAKDNGVSEAEAEEQAKAKGYAIQ